MHGHKDSDLRQGWEIGLLVLWMGVRNDPRRLRPQLQGDFKEIPEADV